jgi:DNA-binding SARP family transcriptional activator
MGFGILGPLEVSADDGHQVVVAAPKQRALLAILLLHANEVVSSDRLVEELWSDEAPARAAKNLQVHVSRLRGALGGSDRRRGARLVTAGGGYVLRVEPGELDSLRFERLIEEGSSLLGAGEHESAAQRLREALGLWRGTPLSDFQYELFAQSEVARLSELQMTAVEHRIRAELALGRGELAIAELERLVRQHPYRERLHSYLMLALYRAGRQAEALDAYRAARAMLVDELGIEPSAELRELHGAILAQDASLMLKPPMHAAGVPSREVFVGYNRELTELEGALDRALGGRGSVILIGGEPGIGKSRLAERVGEIARARSARVLVGRCWEAGGAPAYWPWVQALREYTRDTPAAALREDVGSGAAELAHILPDLRELLPGFGSARPDAEDRRFQLFEAVAGFVRRAATREPIVLVIDDVHAGDEPSCLLLRYMADAIESSRVLIVAAYRNTEVGESHPLRSTLAELERRDESVTLALKGFSAVDTARFVELSAAERGALPLLSSAIHRSSGGNPLFVSQVVRLLDADGRLQELSEGRPLELPQGVGDVIERWLLRLSAECHANLSVASVIGREFGVGELARACQTQDGELVDRVDEAVNAGLVEDAPGTRGRLRFSHDLVREALYRKLSGARRRWTHKLVGEALEETHAGNLESHLAELARHFREAGEDRKAIGYARRAAERAADLLAYEEAIRLYGLALETVEASGTGRAEERGELLVEFADQLALVGDVARARPALAAASREAERLSSDLLAARASLLRGEIDITSGADQGPDAIALVRSALAVFHQRGDALHEARAWGVLSERDHGIGLDVASGDAAERMLACARQAASHALEAKALDRLACSLAYGPAPATEALHQVSDMFGKTESAYTKSKLRMYVAVLQATLGHYAEARELAEQANAGLVELGDVREHARGLSFACSAIELWAGDFVASERYARAGSDTFQRLEAHGYVTSALTCIIEAIVPQGRLDEARRILTAAEGLLTDPYDLHAIQCQARARALIEIASGDPGAAVRSARRAVDTAMGMQVPIDQAANWLTLADALNATLDVVAARDAARRALELAEHKQHAEFAIRAQSILNTAGATGGSAESVSR